MHNAFFSVALVLIALATEINCFIKDRKYHTADPFQCPCGCVSIEIAQECHRPQDEEGQSIPEELVSLHKKYTEVQTEYLRTKESLQSHWITSAPIVNIVNTPKTTKRQSSFEEIVSFAVKNSPDADSSELLLEVAKSLSLQQRALLLDDSSLESISYDSIESFFANNKEYADAKALLMKTPDEYVEIEKALIVAQGSLLNSPISALNQWTENHFEFLKLIVILEKLKKEIVATDYHKTKKVIFNEKTEEQIPKLHVNEKVQPIVTKTTLPVVSSKLEDNLQKSVKDIPYNTIIMHISQKDKEKGLAVFSLFIIFLLLIALFSLMFQIIKPGHNFTSDSINISYIV